MRLNLSINDIKLLAEGIALRTGIEYDECLDVILDILDNPELPIDLLTCFEKCKKKLGNPVKYSLITGAVTGFLISYCYMEKNCTVAVIERGDRK